MNDAQKIQRALEYAGYGSIDGEHHKQWVIDQMIRALCDVPMEPKMVISQYGAYEYSIQGVNKEYRDFVGEDWDEGIAP